MAARRYSPPSSRSSPPAQPQPAVGLARFHIEIPEEAVQLGESAPLDPPDQRPDVLLHATRWPQLGPGTRPEAQPPEIPTVDDMVVTLTSWTVRIGAVAYEAQMQASLLTHRLSHWATQVLSTLRGDQGGWIDPSTLDAEIADGLVDGPLISELASIHRMQQRVVQAQHDDSALQLSELLDHSLYHVPSLCCRVVERWDSLREAGHRRPLSPLADLARAFADVYQDLSTLFRENPDRVDRQWPLAISKLQAAWHEHCLLQRGGPERPNYVDYFVRALSEWCFVCRPLAATPLQALLCDINIAYLVASLQHFGLAMAWWHGELHVSAIVPTIWLSVEEPDSAINLLDSIRYPLLHRQHQQFMFGSDTGDADMDLVGDIAPPVPPRRRRKRRQANQRDKREESFRLHRQYLIAELLKVDGSRQHWNRCAVGTCTNAPVLYCCDCHSPLCGACDDYLHHDDPLHDRQTLGGVTLKPLQTVVKRLLEVSATDDHRASTAGEIEVR